MSSKTPEQKAKIQEKHLARLARVRAEAIQRGIKRTRFNSKKVFKDAVYRPQQYYRC